MPSLQTDLYRPIVDLITDQSTIYTLLFVSSTFNYEAERALYRKISPEGKLVQELLFQHLSRCERVAKLVLDLDLNIGNKIHADDLPYWSSLAVALRAMINLKILAIWYLATDLRTARILDGCLFQLESFTWPFPPRETLLQFLQNQPRIRTMTLRWWPSNAQLPSNALPKLSILGATTTVINALLPGRKITHLFWDPDLFGDDDGPNLARIAPALNNIRVLKHGGLFPAPPLRTVINYFGNLEVFEWDQENPEEIIDSGPLFGPNLHKIVLPYCWHTRPDSKIFIKRLFESIPTLRLVDSEFEKGAPFRWSRGSFILEPTLITSDGWKFH